MESPELKRVDLLELLVEQNRRLSAAWYEGVRDDVFHGHQAQSAILFGSYNSSRGLSHSRSIYQSDIAVVKPIPPATGSTMHGVIAPTIRRFVQCRTAERCRRLSERGETRSRRPERLTGVRLQLSAHGRFGGDLLSAAPAKDRDAGKQ